MNLFTLCEEISYPAHLQINAEYHCDRHVIKMILEYSQLLSTAMHVMPHTFSGCKPITAPLGKSHANHPVALWACALPENAMYLLRMAVALCHEKNHRWPCRPRHAYETQLLALVEKLESNPLFNTFPASFPVAVKSKAGQKVHAPLLEVVSTYRDYYVADKAGFATWRRRIKPMWFLLREECPKNYR